MMLHFLNGVVDDVELTLKSITASKPGAKYFEKYSNTLQLL